MGSPVEQRRAGETLWCQCQRKGQGQPHLATSHSLLQAGPLVGRCSGQAQLKAGPARRSCCSWREAASCVDSVCVVEGEVESGSRLQHNNIVYTSGLWACSGPAPHSTYRMRTASAGKVVPLPSCSGVRGKAVPLTTEVVLHAAPVCLVS